MDRGVDENRPGLPHPPHPGPQGQARLGQPHPRRPGLLLPLDRARPGPGPPRRPPQAAPRALSVEQTRRLLRAAERAAQTGATGGARDRAVVTLLLFTGLRIGELAALNLDDVAVSARKGLVTVRRGKGDRYRQVPLNTDAREALDAWLGQRTSLPGSASPALLLSLKGQRLSTRAIDLTVRRLARGSTTVSAPTPMRAVPTGW